MATKDGSRSPENSEAMLSTARSVIRTCLQVRREEDVLVITDPDTAEVGQCLYEEAARVTDRILLVMMPPTEKPGKEPPLPVSDIMRRNRVIIIATKDSMTTPGQGRRPPGKEQGSSPCLGSGASHSSLVG